MHVSVPSECVPLHYDKDIFMLSGCILDPVVNVII